MKQVKDTIQKIIKAKYNLSISYDQINSWLSNPPKKELGDYSFNCFSFAKDVNEAPNKIAQDLEIEFKKYPEIFENASSIGGYVNFFISNNIFIKEFLDLDFGPKTPKNETVVVDYIGSNIGKPLHIGHICTPIIGQSIINTYRLLGYNVIGDNHLGDWGGIFGKLITAFKLGEFIKNPKNPDFNSDEILKYGELNELIKQDFLDTEETVNQAIKRWNKMEYSEDDLLQAFADSYIVMTFVGEHCKEFDEQFRKEFKKLSQGNEKNIKIWQMITSISVDKLIILLDRLSIKSDFAIGESFYEGFLPKIGNHPDLNSGDICDMKSVVDEIIKNGIGSKNEDGSFGVIFPEDTKIPSCMLKKRDGTHGYLASDLACIKYRLTNGWNPIKIIYCVDIRQKLHLQQCFWIAKHTWTKLESVELIHVTNGEIRLKEGAMSSRKGRIIPLDKLLDQGFEKTKKILEEKGRQLNEEDVQNIAMGAVKYSYLSSDREKDIVFDWDKALSFEGNSGPYIQYSYVRAKKILDKVGAWDFKIGSLDDIKIGDYDKDIIKKLFEFDKVVIETASKYKPHILAQYLFDLAQKFSIFYMNTPKIIDENDEKLKYLRIKIIEKFSEVLRLGFDLLGIKMPKEM